MSGAQREAPDPATEPAPLRRYEVELRMLATRDRVPGLRALAAELAMREDYDLDAIDDARLAVDEVCAIMLANCTPDDPLTFRLLISPDRIEIGAAAPLAAGMAPVVGGMSLRILRTLADSLEHWTSDDGHGRVLWLRFGRATLGPASA